MLEKIILDYVSENLTVSVYPEFPKDLKQRFVILKRSGEGRENHLEASVLIADSYAESKYEAASLNEQVKAVLDSLDTLDEISGIQLSADYPAFDTDNKRYRYQAVYTINHY